MAWMPLPTASQCAMVAGASEGTSGAGLDGIAENLRSAMGQDLIKWVRTRPKIWRSGNIAVVHAAADPNVPLD